jgi:antitoxin FitA
MTTIVIRDVSDDVLRRLQELAAEAGQSLEQFLSGELTRLTTAATMREVLDRIQSHVAGEFDIDDVVNGIESERRFR